MTRNPYASGRSQSATHRGRRKVRVSEPSSHLGIGTPYCNGPRSRFEFARVIRPRYIPTSELQPRLVKVAS